MGSGAAWIASKLAPTLLALCCTAGLLAQPETIPDAEAFQPPTTQRLDALCAAAAESGWAALAPGLRDTAFRAYRADRTIAAEAWQNVYRWAALLGESETRFFPRWMMAVQQARVAHGNMPRNLTPHDQLLGDCLPRDIQARLIANAAFSDEFFATLTPVDFMPQVLQVLGTLYRTDPKNFGDYASLAIAIAVVYDVPPPPDWPHGQVSPEALPRHFPRPEATFAFFIKEDQAGRTYQHLRRLGADELKFVVDIAVSFDDLQWAQKVVDYPLPFFAKTYSMIRYRLDRLQNDVPMWPESTYTLPEIIRQGGICVDQAFFACQAGKARGVPTLLFRGEGSDGRHAWFGFLDGAQKWQLDAGRYAEQRFVTGFARDPQTWSELSDHELQFLSERFRALPSYRQSRVHAVFAAALLAQGDAAAAVQAARKATGYERRNLQAWEILCAALERQGVEPKVREAALREAILALQRYPDLEVSFTRRLVASLRARGETSAADYAEREIARKFQGERVDLSIQQAAQILARSFASAPVPEQVQAYHQVMASYGRGAGMAFFDNVVVIFAEHLMQLGQNAEAVRAVELARQTLKVEPDSQLDTELKRLADRVKK
ncbi:MAG TPA: hypothetical protein VMC06_09050 [Opitutaceae bacterium]|nr:hypothetical protein [Opitutaceae bacterium]